ncbi:MAG TPA: response regulator transcription factor [Chromatiales bacterium]|nr:response regulator transcription factor [Chromatiales bacterium]
MGSMRILIVDDHPVVRQGLRRALEAADDRLVCAEAGDAEGCLERLQAEVFDVVVLDVSLPGRSGVELLKQIHRQWPKLPVLILTMYPEEQYAVRVLKAGAAGFLNKRSVAAELVDAVRKVAAGGRYLSPAVAESLAAAMARPDKPAHEMLSDREFQILRMIAEGSRVSDIASKLSLSVNTVSTYRVRVLKKLDLHHNGELMHYALQHGITGHE